MSQLALVEDEMRDVQACKLCGGVARFLCSTPNEHSQTREVHNFACDACGSIFVGNPLTNDELAVAYSSLDEDSYYQEVSSTTRAKFATTIRDLSRLTHKGASILDIGTGNGLFPLLLLQAGYKNVAAHDIPNHKLNALQQQGVKVFQDVDYASVPSNTFDVITLLDVAEHVLDPEYLFRSCYRILKPAGLIYLHTPAVSRLDKVMRRIGKLRGCSSIMRVWQRSRTSIFHLQNYTPASLNGLLSRAGFEDIQLRKKNELSWPLSRYIRVYLCERHHVSPAVIPLLLPFVYPMLKSNFLNGNKAIAAAHKPK